MSGLLEFFNEYFNFKHIAREKREYKQKEARVEALPEDYRYVYRQIQHYVWWGYSAYSGGDERDAQQMLADLLDLFETGVAEGKRVLDITGEDVAAFCDELLRNAKTYTGNPREALNRDILNKLGKGNGA